MSTRGIARVTVTRLDGQRPEEIYRKAGQELLSNDYRIECLAVSPVKGRDGAKSEIKIAIECGDLAETHISYVRTPSAVSQILQDFKDAKLPEPTVRRADNIFERFGSYLDNALCFD